MVPRTLSRHRDAKVVVPGRVAPDAIVDGISKSMTMDRLIEKMRAHPAITLHRGTTRKEIRHTLGWL